MTPSRKKLGGLVVVVVVVVLIAVHGGSHNTTSGNSGNSGSTATTATTATTAAAAIMPGIGQAAADGDFSFVVKGVSCGASAAAAVSGGGYGETVPAGAQECLVSMMVTDDKNTAQTFFASNQYGSDAAGRKFSADATGAIYLAGSNDDAQINPGITVHVLVPFQIPSGDKLTKVDLHDSAFSQGVTVTV